MRVECVTSLSRVRHSLLPACLLLVVMSGCGISIQSDSAETEASESAAASSPGAMAADPALAGADPALAAADPALAGADPALAAADPALAGADPALAAANPALAGADPALAAADPALAGADPALAAANPALAGAGAPVAMPAKPGDAAAAANPAANDAAALAANPGAAPAANPGAALPAADGAADGEGNPQGSNRAAKFESGTAEYAIMAFADGIETGDLAAAGKVISDRATGGTLTAIKEESLSENELAKLRAYMEKLELVGRPRNSGRTLSYSFNGGSNQVLKFDVEKRGNGFKIKKLTIRNAGKARGR